MNRPTIPMISVHGLEQTLLLGNNLGGVGKLKIVPFNDFRKQDLCNSQIWDQIIIFKTVFLVFSVVGGTSNRVFRAFQVPKR